jgi:hypothetical protein
MNVCQSVTVMSKVDDIRHFHMTDRGNIVFLSECIT